MKGIYSMHIQEINMYSIAIKSVQDGAMYFFSLSDCLLFFLHEKKKQKKNKEMEILATHPDFFSPSSNKPEIIFMAYGEMCRIKRI